MNNSIALLIDCDNISFKMIDPILKEVEQYGDVIIKRAYGNWSSDRLNNWTTKLMPLSIKPIHQIDYTKGKNATDMAIVIDAMDLLHMRKASAIALVSSDSDFTPLAMKLLEEGLKVYVFGSSTTPLSLKNACNVFTDINALCSKPEDKPKDDTKKDKDRLSQSKLKAAALDAFNKESPTGTEVTMEAFNRALKANGIDFKDYGFKQMKVFIDDLDVFKIRINEKSQGFLTLKKISEGVASVNAPATREELWANKALMSVLSTTYSETKDPEKDLNLSTYFNNLANKHAFSHKKYGFSTFKDFILASDLFEIYQFQEQPHVKAKMKLLSFK